MGLWEHEGQLEKNKIISVSSLFKTQQKQKLEQTENAKKKKKVPNLIILFQFSRQPNNPRNNTTKKRKKNKAIKQTKGDNKATPSDQNEI